MADLVEAAGGSTVNLPFAEVIPAMQRGVADCAITGTSAGNTARWWEVTDHLFTLPMGWSMTFFAANKQSWERLSPETQEFLLAEFKGLEDRMWAQAAADVQDGLNCNVGKGECKDGIPAQPPMTLVEVSEADKEQAQQILRDHVLAAWADRCGAECAKEWNETVGTIVDVQAPVN
jgi:TRAP-type transport system periplasmic protein